MGSFERGRGAELEDSSHASMPQVLSEMGSRASGGHSRTVDPAYNKSMIGEYELARHERLLKEEYNLDVPRFPSKEVFNFGDDKRKRVRDAAVRLVGICGHNGELALSIIPKAGTPCLIARQDVAALGGRL